MKYYLVPILLILIFTNQSCNTENTEQVNENQSNGLVDEYKTVQADEICEITIPNYLYKMDDINEYAIIQYGYIQEPDSTNIVIDDEFYVIVLADYKNELKQTLGDTVNVNIMDFNMMCTQNLNMTLDDLTIEYDEPKIQEQNGIKTIHNEFYGRLGKYLVYYQLGVFETEIGYYQILTWCMQDHLTKHKDEMYKITSSFKEL